MGETNRVKAILPAVGGIWFQTNWRIDPAKHSMPTQEYKHKVSTYWPEIVQLVLDIPGVERVLLSYYTLSVFATAAVTIQEVETQVLAAFKEVYPDKHLDVYGINDEIQPQQAQSGLMGRFFSRILNIIFRKSTVNA